MCCLPSGEGGWDVFVAWEDAFFEEPFALFWGGVLAPPSCVAVDQDDGFGVFKGDVCVGGAERVVEIGGAGWSGRSVCGKGPFAQGVGEERVFSAAYVYGESVFADARPGES